MNDMNAEARDRTEAAKKALNKASGYLAALVESGKVRTANEDHYRGVVVPRLENLWVLLEAATRDVETNAGHAGHSLQNVFVGADDVRDAYQVCIPVPRTVEFTGYLYPCLSSIRDQIAEALNAMGFPSDQEPRPA